MGTTTVSGVLCWLSKDPIEEAGGLNLYAFVLNSPPNLTDPLGIAGGVSHGTRKCLPSDSCSELAAKIGQWQGHLTARLAELAADRYGLRVSNPTKYNNHVDKIFEAALNLNNCYACYATHQPPCCDDPPKRRPVRLPQYVNIPLSAGDRFLINLPGSDQAWQNAAIGAGVISMGASATVIVLTGGAGGVLLLAY